MLQVTEKQYVVLHFAKPKGDKALCKLGQHIDREQISANVDARRTRYNQVYLDPEKHAPLSPILDGKIDQERSTQNQAAIQPSQPLTAAIEQRIREGYNVRTDKGALRAIRKDAVKAVFGILSGSHQRMQEMEKDPKLFQQWIDANIAFAKKEFGEENIVRMTLHRDEKTPHFHLVFVPLTPDGRLSAEHYIGGAKKLRAFQDRYAQAMAPFLLQRGEWVERTQAQHVSPAEFQRQQAALTAKEQELVQEVSAKNLFALKKTQAELEKAFQSQRYQLANAHVELAKKTNMLDQLLASKKDALLQVQLKSQAQLKYLTQEIEMPTFLSQKLGYKKVAGGQHGYVRLATEQEGLPEVDCKLIATGDWIYRLVDPTRKEAGNLATFLHKEAKWDWKRIFTLADTAEGQQYMTDYPHKPPKCITYEPIEAEVLQKWSANAHKKLNSVRSADDGGWLKQVGLRPDTLEGLDGCHAARQEAVFSLYRLESGQLELCSTVNYFTDRKTNKPTHRFLWQGGTPGSKGLSILQSAQEPTQIMLFRSPLEALSYRQLVLTDLQKQLVAAERDPAQVKQLTQQLEVARDKTQYIATCGAISAWQMESLEAIFTQAAAKGQQVTLALENAASGQRTARVLREKLFAAGAQHEVVGSKAKTWGQQLQERPDLGGEHEKLPFVAVPLSVPAAKLPSKTLASFYGQVKLEGNALGCEVVTGKEVLRQLRLSAQKHGSLIQQLQGQHEGFVFLRAQQSMEEVVFCTSLEEVIASRHESLQLLKKAQIQYQQLEERVAHVEERCQNTSRVRKELASAREAVLQAEKAVHQRAFWVLPSPTVQQQAALKKLVAVLQQQTEEHRPRPLWMQGLTAILDGKKGPTALLKNGRALREMLKNELEEELALQQVSL